MTKIDLGAGQLTVDGSKQLRASLKQAGMDLQDLKGAHREAADIAAQASADLAPQGKTGKLKKNIRASGTNTAAIIRVGKAVPYANAIHWGRRWWPNKQKAKNTAPFWGRPFLSDGARNSQGQWLPIYERTVDNIIERIDGN